MTTPGYPDYTRIQRAGNQQLFFTNSALVNGSTLFRGFVGSWPYTIMFIDMGVTADFCRIRMQYYSDSTFTNQVGFRFAIRGSGNFSIVSYGNMSDWLLVQVDTKSGNPIPCQEMGIYATMGTSDQTSLDSNDVPLLDFAGSIAAHTVSDQTILHVHPGNSKLKVNSASTSWQVFMAYYDWVAGLYLNIYETQVFAAASTYESDFPQLDAPMRASLFNNSAAAATMTIAIFQGGL